MLLLDKQQFPRDKTCGDALSPSGVRICRELGLGLFLEQIGQPVRGLEFVTPDGRVLRAPIPEAREGKEPVRVIPRQALDEQLRQAAVRAGSAFEGGIWVRGVHEIGEGVEIRGEANGRAVRHTARAAVLAVGAHMKLLRSLGLVRRAPEYSVAARAYFEGLPHRTDRLRLHFDGVPLPGYGWVFPLVRGAGNVGVGLFRRGAPGAVSAAVALRDFLAHPPVRELLGQAVQVSPIKGFPLRTDFHRSPLARGRLLLVGEAAGLVNPFTGEGIDYALESAGMASQALLHFLNGEATIDEAAQRYVRALRARYQRFFQLTTLMRGVYMNRPALNALGRACSRWPELLKLLVEVQLGRQDPWRVFTPKVTLWMLRGFAMVGGDRAQPAG